MDRPPLRGLATAILLAQRVAHAGAPAPIAAPCTDPGAQVPDESAGPAAATPEPAAPSTTAADEAPQPPGPGADEPALPGAPAAAGGGELIEVNGTPPAAPGTVALDATVARQTAGALGEPFRALALLPGVTTSIAAAGYPIIRGTLPGESRFTFDDIEIPMLYHLLLGNQVIHPSFLGDIALRAGGQGAEHGHLIGGLIALSPAPPVAAGHPRTELRANPVEVGAFRAQQLSTATSIAAAARAGTLAIAAKIYDPKSSLYYVDQQTRLVHRLAGGDELTLTSLGAYDYLRQPPDSTSIKTDKLGFHRLDARWTRTRAAGRLRAGIETSIDVLTEISESKLLRTEDGTPEKLPTQRQGGHAYGVRAYSDGRLVLAPWLTARGGVEARHRALVNGESPFQLTASNDPFFGLARAVDAQGAWAALDLTLGRVRVTPGVRSDAYHADLYGAAVRHVTVDPRIAIAAELPGGARAELAAGGYSAPPQLSWLTSGVLIGPLPMADGAGSSAGMNHAIETELSLHTPLGAGLQGSFAAYYRTTHYAIDFAMGAKAFGDRPCAQRFPPARIDRDIDARAMGIEAMIRRDLGHAVTGWVSYSLGKLDRDFGFIELPSDFDQRHTLNATAAWRRGAWLLGATGHVHTGRPVVYPQLATCANGSYQGEAESADVLRRVPTNWRLDLRAERSFERAGWQMRLFFELQNATFTSEVTGYHAEGDGLLAAQRRVVEDTVLVPLPLIGLEVVL